MSEGTRTPISLPDDIIGNILSHYVSTLDVTRVERACCARGDRARFREILRGNVEITELSTETALKWAITRGVRVRFLNVSVSGGCIQLKIDCRTSLLTCCFQKILAHVTQATNAQPVRQTGEGLSGVEFGVLCELHWTVDQATAKSFVATFNAHPYLKKLVVGFHNCSAAAILSELNASENLHELVILLRDTVTGNVFEVVAARFQCLKKLQLTFTTRRSIASEMRPRVEGLENVGVHCTELEELVVQGPLSIAQESLCEFFLSAHKLRVIAVRDADWILTDNELHALAESNHGVPHLTDIHMMYYFREAATITICAAVLAHIRTCALSAFPFGRQNALLASMTHVETLVADMFLLPAVAECCTCLRVLQVHCEKNNEELVTYIPVIAKHNPLLESLQLGCVYRDPEEGTVLSAVLSALAVHSPRLRCFVSQISGSCVTADKLVSFVHACPQLTTLDVSVGATMTDTVLQALAQHSYNLQELHLHREAVVTEVGLVQLVTSCKHLRRLVLSKTVILSPELRGRLMAITCSRGRKLAI
jgi:hypothetical protein